MSPDTTEGPVIQRKAAGKHPAAFSIMGLVLGVSGACHGVKMKKRMADDFDDAFRSRDPGR